MKKQIIIALLLSCLLVSCGGKDDKNDAKTSESPSETPIVSTSPDEESTKAETPSGGTITSENTTKKDIPQIPGDVIYSDDNNVGVKAPHGGLFINGNEVESDIFDEMIDHFKETSKPAYTTPYHGDDEEKETTSKKPVSTSKKPASTSKKPAVATSTSKKPSADKEPETVSPDFTLPEVTQTERPTGTIYLEEEDQFLAKYVKSSNTELGISKVKVYSSAKPGVQGLEAFEPGDTLLVNIWCNTDMRFNSTVYIVPRESKHKKSYDKIECLKIYEMFNAIPAGDGHLIAEIEIPSNTPAGVYELRFVCGSEEGYIPFHFGHSK